MSDPFGFPFGMDPDALRDAPLFRELQRVMASGGGGSVNWELARQVAVASAVEAGPDPAPTDRDRRGLEEAVRVAELQVSQFTGLEAPGTVVTIEAVRRAEWVGAAVESLRSLLEPAAARMSEALARAMGEQIPEGSAPMAGLLTQLGPLLQGSQIGQVFGAAAQRVFGQYDIAVPREQTSALRFVIPNLAAFEKDWSLDPTEFRTFIAIHEVTHRLEFTHAWSHAHFVALIDDFLSTLTIDVAAIQERFASLDPSDPEALQRALGGGEDGGAMFGTVIDDEQRLKLARVQAFVAAAEGYGDHVLHAVGSRLLGTYDRISEAMSRLEIEEGDPLFERLLGVEITRAHHAAGRAFCETVVELTDEATLSRMWESADAMPSMPEIHEPRLWLARTV